MTPRVPRVLSLAEAEVFDSPDGTLRSRRVVRKAHGSDRVSFHRTTLYEGFNDAAIRYDGHDEICFILEGEAEIVFGGERHVVKPGMAFFIPDGCTYAYRVLKGPNEMVTAFSPART